MVKVICRKTYATEEAELIRKKTFGSFGDPEGYEETLYKTPDGYYFLYVNGGENSPHPAEDIKRMSAAAAEKWLGA